MGYTERMNKYSDKMTPLFIANDTIPNELFSAHGVNRGLRDINGKGVLTGLTSISKINAFKEENGQRIPCDGELWYRGYPIQDLVAPSHDIMNSMTRSILTLASYDDDVADLSLNNVLKQCIRLIAVFPMLAVYGYHAYNHYECDESMYIHRPDPQLSTAENLLMMLRPDKSFTYLEAEVLDIALILHMEHGGGNNSTFTTRVVTSSGSDTYSAIGAAMSSLKGPRHGGANLKVMEMMHDIKMHVTDINNEDKVCAYLDRILNKEAFDHKGLIYGMGHAVYSLSDPRERVFKGFVKELSDAKHKEREMKLYSIIEEEATELIAKERKIYKGVSPNVDFYSGFVYDMLGIPRELFTPIFAIARISGWSAHRLEELVGNGKIIRPAYLSVMKEVN